MRARYYRNGYLFATYVLDGTTDNAEALRAMAWSLAAKGYTMIVED